MERPGDGQVVVDDLGQRHRGRPGGTSAPLPCPARRPRPAASRPRSRRRSRLFASSWPRCGRSGTARRASSSPCGRRTAPRSRRRPVTPSPRGRSPRSRAPPAATVLQRRAPTGSPRRNPASMSSSRCFGSGALAEYAVTGSRPIATATGIRPSSAARRSARPSLCICQCMNVDERSITCMRYIPTLRVPVLRVLGHDGRQRDERRRVARPATLDREQSEVDVVSLEHDLLARRPSRPSSGASRRPTSTSGARAPSPGDPRAVADRGRRRASRRPGRGFRRRAPGTSAARSRTG